MRFRAIFRETEREVYSILDRAALVWSPNEGRRFHGKEAEYRPERRIFCSRKSYIYLYKYGREFQREQRIKFLRKCKVNIFLII